MMFLVKNRLHVAATKDTIKIEKDPSANLSLFLQKIIFQPLSTNRTP